MEVGAVAAMRYVKDGIKAARLVMQHTEHTLLVGEKASEFAISMGLPGPANLSSPESVEKWAKWKDSRCQPNFRKNVSPANSCGPYRPTNYLGLSDETCSRTAQMLTSNSGLPRIGLRSHDTISMAVIDRVRFDIKLIYIHHIINANDIFIWHRRDTLLLAHQLMGQHSRYLAGKPCGCQCQY